MTSFDLRPPPLWGGFDFDLGCLLGGVPPCLLEVGLHLKGKGCIAAKRRDVITNKLTDSYVFPERTYSAFSLSAAAAESWSILTPPSSLQNMDKAEDVTRSFLLVLLLLLVIGINRKGVHKYM